MRKLSWSEYCRETKYNSENLRKVIMNLRKSAGNCVPDNFVKMAEEDLIKSGTHYIGDVKLKKVVEDVLVEIEYKEDELLELEKEIKTYKEANVDKDTFMVIEKPDGTYLVKKVCELFTVDVRCDNNLFNVMTTTEAALKWGLSESTVRKAIQKNKFKFGQEYRKSGRITLITKDAMERVYGELHD